LKQKDTQVAGGQEGCQVFEEENLWRERTLPHASSENAVSNDSGLTPEGWTTLPA
jgi:hypothetical protein